MSKISSITFFYPSTIMGGAEYLFMRLAEAISERFKIKIYYVDYQNGFARQNLIKNEHISFLGFFRFKKLILPKDTIVVAPLSSIIDLIKFSKRENDFKILFWSIHPFGLNNVMNHYTKNKEKNIAVFKDDLSNFINLSGVQFMDGPNYAIQKTIFNFNGNPNFLPIPVNITKTHSSYQSSDKIRITWLGRLSEDKIFPLLNVLKHANDFGSRTSKSIEVHIIGEGGAAGLLDNGNFPSVNIFMHGSLKSEKLFSVLTLQRNVLFAMGTSALEGGALRIPTVLVDMSYAEIPQSNRFKWLYETKDFSLADEYSPQKSEGHLFETLINEIITKYDVYADRCYQYVSENHSMQGVSSRLVAALSQTELSINVVRSSIFAKYGKLSVLSIIKSYINYLCKKS